MAGAAGVFQVTSFTQPPPLQWAHRSGFPSHSAADPQEALLTLIENEAVPFTLPTWAGGDTVMACSGLDLDRPATEQPGRSLDQREAEELPAECSR